MERSDNAIEVSSATFDLGLGIAGGEASAASYTIEITYTKNDILQQSNGREIVENIFIDFANELCFIEHDRGLRCEHLRNLKRFDIYNVEPETENEENDN